MKNCLKPLLAVLASLCLLASAYAAEIPNTSVFSQTDANNNSGTVPTWAEGMAPSQANDSARALQGAITRNWNWEHPTVTSGGSANVQTLTYAVAPAAYYNGMRFCFEAGFATTAASTLNVNTVGAVALKYIAAGVLSDTTTNTIRAGDRPCVTYRSTGPSFVLDDPGTGTAAVVAGPASSTDNAITRFDGTSGLLVQNSPLVTLGDNGDLTITSAGYAALTLGEYGAEASGDEILFTKSRHATPGSHTIVQSTDDLGYITFKGSDGTNFDSAAQIRGVMDGTPGAGTDMPGALDFYTSPDGTATLTKRLSIKNNHDIWAWKDDGANPGQLRAEHWISLTSDNTLSNSGSAQPIFDGGGGPANGRLTVDTGTYGIECHIIVTSMSGTSGNAALSIAGTATLANILQNFTGLDATTLTTAAATGGSATQAAISGTNVVTAGVGTAMYVDWNGQFDVTVAGTLIPQITLTTAAAAVVEQGSRCSFYRLGATATATTGAWD